MNSYNAISWQNSCPPTFEDENNIHVNGHFQVINGRIWVTNGHFQVINGRIYVSNGRICVSNGRFYVINGRIYVSNGRFLVNWQMYQRALLYQRAFFCHQRAYLCYQRAVLCQLATGNGQRATGVLVKHFWTNMKFFSAFLWGDDIFYFFFVGSWNIFPIFVP